MTTKVGGIGGKNERKMMDGRMVETEASVITGDSSHAWVTDFMMGCNITHLSYSLKEDRS